MAETNWRPVPVYCNNCFQNLEAVIINFMPFCFPCGKAYIEACERFMETVK